MNELPITPYLDTICDTLARSPSRFLVLTAETAAGKSTAVPLALLNRFPGTIVMLEPRRIATLAIATRLSDLLGESPGQTVGYRLHLDSKISGRTRIEIMTEAILTRRIQGDPELSGISVVILDEFHERSVHADLALALLREISELRDDLYVLVMSATIDAARIAAFLNAPTISVPGRQWPVAISHIPPSTLEETAARVIKEELRIPGGNILVFLPGIAEIRRTATLLAGADAEIFILHGSLPFEEQRRVLDGTGEGRRVILSSSIAETSITVPGVSIVIDSGLARINRLDIGTGMDRLVTETESVFSASQRAGRAGRTGPGRCLRLWAEHDLRLSLTPPEIERTDILPMVLECALWGVTSPQGLDWLDPPNQASWERAQFLLKDMNAVDAKGIITAKGRSMTTLGVHPRIAAVALAGNLDLAMRYSKGNASPRDQERGRADLARRLQAVKTEGQDTSVMALVSGFPDRIARHTADGIYQFPSGRLASLPRETRATLSRPPKWIIAPDVDAGEREGRIWAFEILPETEIEAWLDAHSVRDIELSVSEGKKNGDSVRKTEVQRYGKLILAERPLIADATDIGLIFCAHVRKTGLETLPWTEASRLFVLRAKYYQSRGKGSQTGRPLDDESLLQGLEEWLLPFVDGRGSLTAENLLEALRYRAEGSTVDREVPSKIVLVNGLSRPLMFEEIVPGDDPVPVLETRIQDLFGCPETPILLGEPILLRLLSPARRPVQITRDLAGFWKNTWPEVIKELKGRYPKHKWPENPLIPVGPR